MDRTVPSNCLGSTTSTRCIRYDGPAFPNLDIETGDSLEWVLAQIISGISGATSDTSATYNLSCLVNAVTSPCGSLISERTLALSKSSATAGVTVVWDATAITTGLPQGQNIQTAQILIRGVDGSTQYSGANSTGQMAIPLAAFPVTMDYRLFIWTECGNIQLSGTFALDANPGSSTQQLGLIDAPTAASSVNSEKDAIELLAREICTLKNLV